MRRALLFALSCLVGCAGSPATSPAPTAEARQWVRFEAPYRLQSVQQPLTRRAIARVRLSLARAESPSAPFAPVGQPYEVAAAQLDRPFALEHLRWASRYRLDVAAFDAGGALLSRPEASVTFFETPAAPPFGASEPPALVLPIALQDRPYDGQLIGSATIPALDPLVWLDGRPQRLRIDRLHLEIERLDASGGPVATSELSVSPGGEAAFAIGPVRLATRYRLRARAYAASRPTLTLATAETNVDTPQPGSDGAAEQDTAVRLTLVVGSAPPSPSSAPTLQPSPMPSAHPTPTPSLRPPSPQPTSMPSARPSPLNPFEPYPGSPWPGFGFGARS